MDFHNVIPSDRIPELFSVEGRVCLITGAGGLGETVARAFAHNGAKIALANRTIEKADRVRDEILAEGGECRSYQLDVKSLEDCRKVTDAVERDFGRIDILIHTSAVAQVCDTLHPDDAELKNTLETNFIGSVHINETVSAVMVKNRLWTHHQHQQHRRLLRQLRGWHVLRMQQSGADAGHQELRREPG